MNSPHEIAPQRKLHDFAGRADATVAMDAVPEMNSLQLRGNASAEEVAAVLTALTCRSAPPARPGDPYARWRATRRAALHEHLHPRPIR